MVSWDGVSAARTCSERLRLRWKGAPGLSKSARVSQSTLPWDKARESPALIIGTRSATTRSLDSPGMVATASDKPADTIDVSINALCPSDRPGKTLGARDSAVSVPNTPL